MAVMQYRGDIDGLRAVAVVMVVLYHFLGDPSFNGYVGVDVFFVISGYLITKIIVQDVAAGAFSLTTFYERRARRIMPALTLVLAVSALAAYLLFLPAEMLAFAQSLIAAVTFSSNMFFWQEAGYFDMEAALKPLLHTWSLAVEEQFYILYPLLLAACAAWGKARLQVLLCALFLASFIANLAFVYTGHFETSFYLFPMRAWELLAGGILALGVPNLSDKKMKAMGWAALAILTASFAVEFDEKKFPGLYALGPVLGASLAIYAGQGQGGWFTKTLGHAAMRFVGKISYSLYLWHWPVYVFASYWLLGDVKPQHIVLMTVASVALAWLSWRFVEQPWRHNKEIFTRKRVFAVTVISIAVLAAIGIGGVAAQGARYKFDAVTLRLSESAVIGGDYKPIDIEGLDGKARLINGDKPPVAAIWGDSHAEAIAPAVEAALGSDNGVLINGNDCFLPSEMNSHVRDCADCVKRTDAVLHYLETTKGIKTVVLAGRWAEHLKFWYRHDYTRDEAIALRLASLERIVERLERSGKTVLIVKQVPQIVAGNDAIPSLLARIHLYGLDTDLRPMRIAYNIAQADMMPVYEALEAKYPGLLIKPDDVLCNAERCAVEEGGASLYYDDDHLSRMGAQSLSALFRGKL